MGPVNPFEKEQSIPEITGEYNKTTDTIQITIKAYLSWWEDNLLSRDNANCTTLHAIAQKVRKADSIKSRLADIYEL